MGRSTVALLLFLCFLVIGIAVACGDGADQPGPTGVNISPAAIATPTPAPPVPQEPPARDLMELARRFRGLPADASRLARLTPNPLQVGDSQEFTIIDLETPATLRISATLRLITDHAYFFVQDGVPVSLAALDAVGADFEAQVYPRVTAAFGREWSPGVDSDPHITILHANLKGASGYVSLSDMFPAAAVPYSNEHEMIYLDASLFYLDGIFGSSQRALYNAVLAHELQHLVHADADEEAWVNEGLSQVASELVGVAPGASTSGLRSFLTSPDTQLNYWPVEGDTGVHYAASQLFFRYLLDRFGGRENASQLLGIQENGIVGVEAYLRPFGATFVDVFADWLAANYLDEAGGPYSHADIEAHVTAATTIRDLDDGDGSVHQFAADYLEVEPPAEGAVFTFDGADQVSIGVPPHDGPFWWSNRGDAIDSRLTRQFDLTGAPRATLRFWTWFDIERGWDYAYVAASTDEGKTWRALRGRRTTDYDPVGAAYGPGFTGASDGREPRWVQEEVDLTPFAGRKVLLRIEYVTDDAANLTGFAVDDVEVSEIGFRDTADGDGGWTAEGFRRIAEPLQQRFLLQIIERGQPPRVTRVPLDAFNRAQIPLAGPATVVIAAITEGTTEAAPYRWSLSASTSRDLASFFGVAADTGIMVWP